MSIFPQSLPQPPFSPGSTYSARDLDASTIELMWLFFLLFVCLFFISRAAQTLFNYRRGKRTPPLLGEMSWCSFPLDKLSRGLHTVSCVIGCVSLDFILALLPGHHECVCAQWLAGYWQGVGVRVCVSAQTACEDVLVNVYSTPPSVSDEQNTYVIWKRLISSSACYHPKLFQISSERRIFCADYCGGSVEHNCTPSRVWKSQHRRHLQPPLFIFRVWRSPRPRLSSHWSISSPVFLSGLIRASEKRGRPEAGRRALTQLSHSSRLIFRQRLSKTHLPWPHSKRHNRLRYVLQLVDFYMNALSLLSKRNKSKDKQCQEEKIFSVSNNIIHMRCKTVWELHLWRLHWLISSNALGTGQQCFISSGGKMEIYSSSVLECFLLLCAWTYEVNILLHLFAGIATNSFGESGLTHIFQHISLLLQYRDLLKQEKAKKANVEEKL